MDLRIRHIAKHYGFHHQLTKATEECGEFIAALSKLANDEGNLTDVIDEMADVMVMLEQVRYFLGIRSSALHEAIDAKVKRQIERIIYQ